MTIDLVGDCGTFSLDLPSWYFAIELAQDHGWAPAGTRPPCRRGQRRRRWDGNYVTNDGQEVLAPDARHWADALEEALADVPDHDARGHKPGASPLPRAIAPLLRDMPGDIGLPATGQRINAMEWFSGGRKKALRAFIAFCRRGQFAIH